MPIFIVLTVIIVVVVLIAKSIHDARHDPEAPRPAREPRPARAPRPQPRARPKPRRPTKPVDEAALAEHVTKLREAIAADLVTTEEAVASICRFTEGALSEDAARELLRRQGAA
ncbi:MAG: hypothetical protein WD080_00565 [Egibacteraceae bacterium]